MSDDYGRRPLAQDGRCFMCERGIPTQVIDGETYHVERLVGANISRKDGSYRMGRILCFIAHPLPAAASAVSDREPTQETTE